MKRTMAKSAVPSLADRLRASQEARRAQLQRAQTAAASPEAVARREARQAIVAARDLRIATRKAEEQARKAEEQARREHEEIERAAAEAEALRVDQEARASEELARARREAAEQAERERILAARRAGRKAKKRRG